MASAQVVETSVNNNSPSQDSNHADDLFQSRYVTPGCKPFSYLMLSFLQKMINLLLEIRVLEIHVLEIRVLQSRVLQIRALQIRVLQIRVLQIRVLQIQSVFYKSNPVHVLQYAEFLS